MAKKNDNIESEYLDTMTITDPVTGKLVTHQVKVVKYKTPTAKSKSVIEELEDEIVVPALEEDFEE